MNEALAGFWWFEDLSLLMDRGGHVLWAILVLSTVLWMILLTGARRLKDAEKAWTAATAAPDHVPPFISCLQDITIPPA